MNAPVRLDGSKKGRLVTRKIVVWRRLEPGDVRTPGTELAPESPHLETQILVVGVSEKTLEDARRLWKKKDEVTGIASSWTRRYEPAGVLFAIGGSGVVAVLLDYMPASAFWVSVSLAVLGTGVGALTRARKRKAEAEADALWAKTDERRELEQLRKRLEPRWTQFTKKVLEQQGYRTDVRVGDIHEADRLASIDLDRLTHPSTWEPDEKRREVRYGWVFSDGRYSPQVAELEDSDVPIEAKKPSKSKKAASSDEEE